MIKWLTHNFRWKVFSLLIAVFLWVYINNELSYQKISTEEFRIRNWNSQGEMRPYHEIRRQY